MDTRKPRKRSGKQDDKKPKAEIQNLRKLVKENKNLAKLERDLLVSGPVITFKFTVDEKHSVYYSSPNVERFGYSPDDFKPDNLHYIDIVHPDDKEWLLRDFDAYNKSATTHYEQEYRVITKNGHVRWVNDFTYIQRDKRGKATHHNCYIIDITERKAAEQALRFTQFAVDHTSDAAFWIAEDGRFVYVNEAACTILGYSMKELLSHSVFVIDNDVTKEQWPVRWQNLKIHKTLTAESHHKTKVGRVFPVEITANYVVFDGKEYNCSFVRDITQRTLTQQALQESEFRLKTVSDLITDYIFKLAVTPEKKVFFEYVSDNFYTITGRTMDDVRNPEQWSTIFHPEDREKALQKLAKTMTTGEDIDFEFRSFIKDNQIRWVHIYARPILDERTKTPIAIIGAVRDITSRKQAQVALKEKTDELNQFFDLSLDLLCIANVDGYLRRVNLEWEKALGYTRDELENHRFLDFIHPDDIEKTLKILSDLSEQKKIYNFTNRYRHKDGSYRWLEWRAFPAGRQIYGAARDITDRIRAIDIFKKTFMGNPSSMAIGRIDTGEFLDVNDAFCRLLGYTREEAIGKTSLQLGVFCDPYARQALVQVLKQQGYFKNSEQKFRTKNGSIRYGLFSGDSVEIAGEKLLLSVFQDITERKAAEDALAKSEGRYRSIVENVNDAIIIHDFNGNTLDVNDTACRLLGYSREELLGGTLQGIDSPDNPRPFSERMTSLIYHGSIVFDGYFIRKNGTRVPVNVSAKIVSREGKGIVQGFVRDMTERKKAEDALAAEKERLLVTLRSIGDGVITTDISGRVVLMNRVAEELTEWTGEESFGRPLQSIFTIVNEHTRQRCENPVEKVLETGEIIALANHTMLISKTGRERIIADSGAPIRDGENNIVGVVLVFRDITERQKMSEALQNAAKLESIGLLAGGIAHDFNNMLSGIFGYIDLARLNITESERAYDFLTKALGVFGRAKDLTQQLLTFSKGGDPIKQTMSIAPVLKDCVHFMLSGSNISPVFTIPDTLWLCDIDRNQIGQVIDNIVINARQAMPTGGSLFISAENISPDSKIPATLRPGNYIKITIRDSGIGIAKEHLLRIFDPFFTTKQQGSGLGLATAYSIVKKHEGYIAVESELGRGTAFHIFLPAVVLSHVAAEDTKEERLVKGSGRILVLDDEEYIRLVITTILTSFGYAIVAASDDEEAIEAFTKAKNESAPFDLVILDLTVPGGLGGKDVLAKLLKFDPAIKAIASSGYSNDPVISAPGKFGFAGSLIKPFLHRALVQVVQETLNRK